MLPDVLPREICSKTVDLGSVVSDEEDEVLGGEVARTTTRRKRTSLENLDHIQLGTL